MSNLQLASLNRRASTQHFFPGYFPLCRIDSSIHMHGLGVCIRDNLPRVRGMRLGTTPHSMLYIQHPVDVFPKYLFSVTERKPKHPHVLPIMLVQK